MTQFTETETHEASGADWDGSAQTGGYGSSGAGDSGEPVGLLRLAVVLLRRWKLIVGLPVAAALVTAAISLLLTEKYTAITTFVPEVEERGLSLPSGLAGVAAQFGLSVPGAGGNSPRFYADVLRSRTLRDQVLAAGFADPRTESATDSVTLLELLQVEGESEAKLLEMGRARLKRITTISVDNETNIVSVGVETPYPELSAALANHYITLLNFFNLETRRSEAKIRRTFIEGQVAAAQSELWKAEEALKEFLERNRQYRGSPDLQFQYERLNRQVLIKQEVLTSLSRQYEEARIHEVNDTPIITVIDRAVAPVEKSSPQRKASVMLAFFLSSMLALVWAFGADYMEGAKQRDRHDFDELTSQLSSIKDEIRSKLRLSRRG
jgi:uncharacterized protein involved in exopolysaccharide biosynthesis